MTLELCFPSALPEKGRDFRALRGTKLEIKARGSHANEANVSGKIRGAQWCCDERLLAGPVPIEAHYPWVLPSSEQVVLSNLSAAAKKNPKIQKNRANGCIVHGQHSILIVRFLKIKEKNTQVCKKMRGMPSKALFLKWGEEHFEN